MASSANGQRRYTCHIDDCGRKFKDRKKLMGHQADEHGRTTRPVKAQPSVDVSKMRPSELLDQFAKAAVAELRDQEKKFDKIRAIIDA